MNEADLNKKLEAVNKELGSLRTEIRNLGSLMPSKTSIEEVAETGRMLRSQRTWALGCMMAFAALTLIWMIVVSAGLCCRPSNWLSLASVMAPAVIWLVAGAIILRWLRVLR